MDNETLKVRFQEGICFLQIHRPEAGNAINERLVDEFARVLDRCEQDARIVVLEGLPEVFCFGADFKAIQQGLERGTSGPVFDPGPMYDLWQRLAGGPYVTIAHVRGQANAGGIGFVAACDIVLAQEQATFALSELLFGLMPACVLPFLVRRIGQARANTMTLMTEPVPARCAQAWGLVDEVAEDSAGVLRKKLLRLRRLSKTAILRYKGYMRALDGTLGAARTLALDANRQVFSDPDNLRSIARYVSTGRFPWEEGGT